MKYLKAIRILSIMYDREEKGDLIIKNYFDLDWISDYTMKKSISRFIFILNRGPLSWCSKKQAIVALLLTEAKYIMLILVVKKAT